MFLRPEVPMDKKRMLRGAVIVVSDSETGAQLSADVLGGGLADIDVHRWLQEWLKACADGGRAPPDLAEWLPWSMSQTRRRALIAPAWPAILLDFSAEIFCIEIASVAVTCDDAFESLPWVVLIPKRPLMSLASSGTRLSPATTTSATKPWSAHRCATSSRPSTDRLLALLGFSTAARNTGPARPLHRSGRRHCGNEESCPTPVSSSCPGYASPIFLRRRMSQTLIEDWNLS